MQSPCRKLAACRCESNANPCLHDVYRASSVAPGNGTQEPAFTFSLQSYRKRSDGTTYADTGLTLGRVYYYIVQARDLNNGKKDANNTGNTIVKFSAPTSTAMTPVFALENFEGSSANTRFVPPLVDSATPNQTVPAFQRVPGIQVNGGIYFR
jgi:hypothetical protein